MDERSAWVFPLVSLGATLVYIAIILSRAVDTPIADVRYISPLIWTIGITIVGTIVALILTAIVVRPESDKSDERDKAINRHGEYVAYSFTSIGFAGVLVLAMMEVDHFWIANAIYIMGFIGGQVSSIVKIMAYRRGF